MRRVPAPMTAIVLATVLFMTTASASPPSGDLSYTDYGRGTVAEGISLDFPSGTDISTSTYTMAPGSNSGWRTHPGAMALVVTKGELALTEAQGCTTKKYPTGQAAVVPAGQYLVASSGSEPLTFVGVFINLPVGAPKPLVEGDPDPAPANCRAIAAASAGETTVADIVQGTFIDTAGYYGHPPAGFDSKVEANKDVLVSYYKMGPGASAGWHTHPDAIGIMLRGTFSYYEGHDGKCVKTGVFKTGQAWYVKSHEGHSHLGVNEEDEPLEVIGIYFNVGDKYKSVPLLGNQMDALDFSPMPPADCPRLVNSNV